MRHGLAGRGRARQAVTDIYIAPEEVILLASCFNFTLKEPPLSGVSDPDEPDPRSMVKRCGGRGSGPR